jgi:hypothetical protein
LIIYDYANENQAEAVAVADCEIYLALIPKTCSIT